MLAAPLTPAALVERLSLLGYAVNERWLTDCRAKRLLPRLAARGRGRGKGKEYFWRHPRLADQTAAVHRLRAQLYPTDVARMAIWLMGFPVDLRSVQLAWLSELHRLENRIKTKTAAAVRRRGSKFDDPEDLASELVTPYVRRFVRAFLVDGVIEQLSIELFRSIFERGYLIDPETGLEFSKLAAVITGLPREEGNLADEKDFQVLTTFLRGNMSYAAVTGAIQSATPNELRQAHRHWRAILRIAEQIIPELGGQPGESSGLTIGELLAIQFGRICVPAITLLIRAGRGPEIAASIHEIEKFISRSDVRDIYSSLTTNKTISAEARAAIFQLMTRLAAIWDYNGFPFFPTKTA
jgi:hypothetical protein